jgi:hypothetical protein
MSVEFLKSGAYPWSHGSELRAYFAGVDGAYAFHSVACANGVLEPVYISYSLFGQRYTVFNYARLRLTEEQP